MIVRIDVGPAARRELAQALLTWVAAVRADNGAAHLYEDAESSGRLCLVSEWPTQAALDAHAGSREFGSLAGAVELLARSSSVVVAKESTERCDLRDCRRRATACRGTPTTFDSDE